VPQEVHRRSTIDDTYPMEQTQADLYLILSSEMIDLCLYGKDHGIGAAALSSMVGLDTDQVQRVYDAIDTKRAAAQYLRAAPLLMEELAGL
jgi:NAD+ synthase